LPRRALPSLALPRLTMPRQTLIVIRDDYASEVISLPCHALPRQALPCHAMPCRAGPCPAMPDLDFNGKANEHKPKKK